VEDTASMSINLYRLHLVHLTYHHSTYTNTCILLHTSGLLTVRSNQLYDQM
jgi:hypothetical protein